MAVPNTTTFSLQDVVTELGITSNQSLTNCFSIASISQFDSNYAESRTELDDFRNYGANVSLRPFGVDGSNAWSEASAACYYGDASEQVVKYFNGSTAVPAIGDTVYNDINGTTTFGNNSWVYSTSSTIALFINSSGLITDLDYCGN